MVQNIQLCKTSEIYDCLFVISICHAISFGGKIKQETVDKIITCLNEDSFELKFLDSVCEKILDRDEDILLNPVIGITLDLNIAEIHSREELNVMKYSNVLELFKELKIIHFHNGTKTKEYLMTEILKHYDRSVKDIIPADCDLIIGDKLYDIKCNKSERKIRDLLQLLGYSALLNHRSKRPKEITILNLLQGTYTTYDISHIMGDQIDNYLKNILGKKPTISLEKRTKDKNEGKGDEDVSIEELLNRKKNKEKYTKRNLSKMKVSDLKKLAEVLKIEEYMCVPISKLLKGEIVEAIVDNFL